jgi:hypothetical protein
VHTIWACWPFVGILCILFGLVDHLLVYCAYYLGLLIIYFDFSKHFWCTNWWSLLLLLDRHYKCVSVLVRSTIVSINPYSIHTSSNSWSSLSAGPFSHHLPIYFTQIDYTYLIISSLPPLLQWRHKCQPVLCRTAAEQAKSLHKFRTKFHVSTCNDCPTITVVVL